MNRLVAGLVLSGCVVVGGAGVLGHSESRPQVERIEEDDPRWDCETMGNRVCGPELIPGTVQVPASPTATASPWTIPTR